MSRSAGLVRASSFQGAARAMSLGLQAVQFAILARLLAPTNLGYYVAALALFGIAGAIGEFGLVQTTLLDLHRRRGQERAVVVASGLGAAILGLGSLCVAAVFTIAFLPHGVRFPALVLVPAFVVVRAQVPLVALRQHRLEFVRLAGAELAGRAVAVLVLTPLALGVVHFGASAIFLGAGLSTFLGAVITVGALATRLGVRTASAPRLTDARRLVREAVPLGLANASSVVHMRVDQVILAALGISAGLAAYGVAYRVLDAALALVTAVGVVTLPHLVRASGDDRVVIAVRVERLLMGLALLVGVAAFAVAPLAVNVLGGGRYPEAGWYVRLLCPALVISVMNLGYAQIAIVVGRARALLGISLGAVAANVVLNLVLVPRLGVRGSIMATLVTEAVGVALVAVLADRTLNGTLRPHLMVSVVGGFSLACFGGLAAWRAGGVGLAAAPVLVGALAASWPLIRRPTVRRTLSHTLHNPLGGRRPLCGERPRIGIPSR
ncbi:MAG: oligosaccharide flippase family protein [Actinomycetota bacterium]|nr:oligosaccharide flippase family protein [Actinomycetota bacterium]MDQ6947815.1 oligosaccharide flippase family protein [Actinomycetota bacterium]